MTPNEASGDEAGPDEPCEAARASDGEGLVGGGVVRFGAHDPGMVTT